MKKTNRKWPIFSFFIPVDGNDYIGKVELLTFSSGQTQKRVEVIIVNNDIYEQLQTFSAELTTTDDRVDIFEPLANVQIIDDDGRNSRYTNASFFKLFLSFS